MYSRAFISWRSLPEQLEAKTKRETGWRMAIKTEIVVQVVNSK